MSQLRTPEDVVTWLNRWGTPSLPVRILDEEELRDLRRQWKTAFPHIEAVWREALPEEGSSQQGS